MLDYKTCLALKEAGLSQDFNASNYYYTAPGVSIAPEFKEIDKEKMVKVLSLEELIGACGDGFESLTRTYYGHSNKEPLYYCNVEMKLEILRHEGNGKTPTEAVANLYLLLKKQ